MSSGHQIRRVALVVLLILGGTVVYFLLRPNGYDFKAGAISFLDSDADLTINQMHVVQNKQGVKNWEMWADTAKIYREKNITKLESIHIRFYPKSGEPMDITADSGVMESDSRDMRIRGNVVIKTAEGYSLRTDTLRFRPKEKKFDTEDKVYLKGNSFSLTGVGLHGQTDLGLFKLDKKVNAVIYNMGPNVFAAAPERATLPASPEGTRPPSGGSTP